MSSPSAESSSQGLRAAGPSSRALIRSVITSVRDIAHSARDHLPASNRAPSIPKQLTTHGSRPEHLPLPTGWSREDVFELLSSLSIDGGPSTELATYVETDFERFLLTWDLVSDRAGASLEIGANPYFTTVLLREFTQLDLTLTNSFGGDELQVLAQRVSYHSPAAYGLEVDCDIDYLSLNVETTTFPWEAERFRTVLFCEVLEHLTLDPVFALSEINRVLEVGGVLVVTTPNVARLENVARLAAGANIYDPYSGYGQYGRHNREYTRHELVNLLEFCGFSAEHHFTADVHAHHAGAYVDPRDLTHLLEHRLADLGQYLFCRAVKVGPPRKGRPTQLFRSLPEAVLVDIG